MMRICLVSILGCFTLSFLVGCGDGAHQRPIPVPVSGTVVLDGKNLPEGKIYFVPPGFPAETFDIKDGSFQGKVPPGQYRMEFAVLKPGPVSEGMADKEPPMINSLPPKLHSESTLKEEVKASGGNTFTFKLSSN